MPPLIAWTMCQLCISNFGGGPYLGEAYQSGLIPLVAIAELATVVKLSQVP